ncbi:MAG: class I SAM-dependent methyltransferase [Pseudomonadales bacterium]
MDLVTQKKWDKAAPNFDLMSGNGAEKRWLPFKKELYANMNGRILFLALGTGLDIQAFPKGKTIESIDISPEMLKVAKPRIDKYDGRLNAQVMDVHELDFEDNEFDQVFTSCTFCSVPNPVQGLRSLKRVLKPGGELNMFEHTGSQFFPFSLMMNMMTLLSKNYGPDMNRTTVSNVEAAGFELREVDNVFLDVVKIIKAIKPE